MVLFRRGLGLLLAFLAAATPAWAAPEDDYVVLMTALGIDRACGALKYMEYVEAHAAAGNYLSSSTTFNLHNDGRVGDDDYDAWFKGLSDKIDANIAAVGCTQQALQFILPAKATAADRLYQGLVLAFHYDATTEVLDRIPLDDHKRRSASGYEAYLQQLYGQNFEAFAARQRELAAQKLPVVNPFGQDMLGLERLDPEFMNANFNAQSIARSAMGAVQFEVTAEASGFLVRPRPLASGYPIPQLQRAGSEELLPAVKLPGYQLLDNEEGTLDEIYSVIVLMPDRHMRVMFYGEKAAKLTNPTVRLYVRTEPPPPGSNPWGLFDIPGFRNGATAFDATPAAEPCLGAPCFDLPVEATEAMLADVQGYYSEFFVDYAPNAEPPEITSTTFGRNRFGNDTLWELLK